MAEGKIGSRETLKVSRDCAKKYVNSLTVVTTSMVLEQGGKTKQKTVTGML